MIFFDTSVLLPAIQRRNPNQGRTAPLLLNAKPEQCGTAAHALSELYGKLTGMPKPYKLAPNVASSICANLNRRLTVATLSADEVLSTIRDAAARDISGGAIHDAILVACARKLRADVIYTFNLRDFQRIAPDLAPIIREP